MQVKFQRNLTTNKKLFLNSFKNKFKREKNKKKIKRKLIYSFFQNQYLLNLKELVEVIVILL